MKCRRLALLIALYVGLDLTNPFMPGAFNFDESVEGVSVPHERLRHHQAGNVPAPRPTLAESSAIDRVAPTRRPEVRALVEWFVDLRQVHPPASDSQSPSEDH
jgi:hypothetical protein